MKRFTATEKWDDPWFWELSPQAKLLWLFLCDHCDGAGIIQINLRFASMKIGLPVNEKHLTELESRLHKLECSKVLIIGFIRFQFGSLSRDCKPHNPIFASIDKHGLTIAQIDTLSKGYGKGMDTLQEKEKEREKEQEGGIGGSNGRHRNGFTAPSLDEARSEAKNVGLPLDEADKFLSYHQSKGWIVGKSPMKDWRAAMRTWKLNFDSFQRPAKPETKQLQEQIEVKSLL